MSSSIEFIALTCPQCGGQLPRQARWKMVQCPYCNSSVTRADDVVQAKDFHKAWLRAQARLGPANDYLVISDAAFRMLAPLGTGEYSQVFLAERMSIFPERVIIKLAHPVCRDNELLKEFTVLETLQSLSSAGSAYFSQRLPQAVSLGHTSVTNLEALILRQPVGYWGSLEDVMIYNPDGIDPRHAVWMFRRILDVLGFIHNNGWVHGDINPGHLLVHPADHGILLIGWRNARQCNEKKEKARDIMQAVWSMRALLCGNADDPGFGSRTPAPLAAFFEKASEDASWCAQQGAPGLDDALKAAALEAFGPPSFVPFYSVPSKTS